MAFQVAVCGPAEATETERRAAEEVGELLARRGAVVLCGGGAGVMAAVAAGAHRANGLVIGILPGTDASDAAPGLSATVRTGLGEARNVVLVNSADAVVVIGGSWGTLSEQALAVRRGGPPVVVLRGWQVLDPSGHPVPGVTTVNSPAEAVAVALAAVPTSRPLTDGAPS
jgi:hypothetical protein